MKKGRFLWSAYRITEKQKAGKARNIKEKQLKNSRNTVSKQLVEHHSSANVNYTFLERTISKRIFDSSGLLVLGSFFMFCVLTRNTSVPLNLNIFNGSNLRKSLEECVI